MMKVQTHVVLLLGMLLSWHCFAGQEDMDIALVKQGAFLLSEKPDALRDDLMVHSLVGYLPTGTRVVVGAKQIVTNLNTSDDETYYYVKSELGIQGLLREDLMIQAEGRKLAVSIASYPIPIHQPNATLDNPRKRLTLGRHGGNYLEITGESEEGFYDVVLHRTNYQSSGLPETEKARLKKLYVERNQVSVLNPDGESLMQEFENSWAMLTHFDTAPFRELVETINDKVKDSVDNVKALIIDVNDLQCLLEGTLDGELGFKVFSNGFALELDMELKKKGIKFVFEANRLRTNGMDKYYSGIGVVQCDGYKPIRLQSFTIQEGMYSSARRMSITLADLKKSKSKWITTLQGNAIANKMVRISGWDEYNQLMKELNGYAMQGDGYLSTLPEKNRLLLLNYIVSRIAYFEHRDIRVDPM